MTETASSTFSPTVAPLQNFTNHPHANSCINDRFPISPSLHDPSRENQSDIAQPPVEIVLSNGDSHPLQALCARLHSQVVAFLDENFKSTNLQAVQAQTRRSLQIIQEALDRYPYFNPFPPSFPSSFLSTLSLLSYTCPANLFNLLLSPS